MRFGVASLRCGDPVGYGARAIDTWCVLCGCAMSQDAFVPNARYDWCDNASCCCHDDEDDE